MNKRVLIISPYFPPSNAADMQRTRMSLPYFKDFGWDATIVTVDPQFSEIVKDELLNQSVPDYIKIYRVKALNKSLTSKVGLGSLALRSMFFYIKIVNGILKKDKYDLIYFSTTEFPVCILGAYWKKKYKISYVIDMQDPWHSDYYKNKPKEQQPAKYWFSYSLNKYLEPIALKSCDGLISVSKNYIEDLKERYPVIKNIPEAVITFGSFEKDMQIAEANQQLFKSLLNDQFTNIVYIGRGGIDMHKAITPVFEVLKAGLNNHPETYKRIKLYFIGTSYAASGKGITTILPLAKKIGVEQRVVEITDRISFYHMLITLKEADALFIPGSDNPQYSASKIYPYLLTYRPLLTIFNSNSGVIDILNEFGSKYNYTYDKTNDLHDKIHDFLTNAVNVGNESPVYCKSAEEKYASKNIAEQQCKFFTQVLNGKN
jgi:hypothetical protein